MKIYLLKKEEGEEEFFFSVKKNIFLPSGKYLEKLGTLRYPGRGRGGRHPEVKCSILGTN